MLILLIIVDDGAKLSLLTGLLFKLGRLRLRLLIKELFVIKEEGHVEFFGVLTNSWLMFYALR